MYDVDRYGQSTHFCTARPFTKLQIPVLCFTMLLNRQDTPKVPVPVEHLHCVPKKYTAKLITVSVTLLNKPISQILSLLDSKFAVK